MKVSNQYWAGLFDGEGHIYFAKDLRHMTVGVTQKETAILFLLKGVFGGRVYKSHANTCHRWEAISKAQTLPFLEVIAPYVIIKAVEVQVAIEALSGFRNSKYNSGGMNPPLDAKELKRRKLLRDKMMTDRADPKIIKN